MQSKYEKMPFKFNFITKYVELKDITISDIFQAKIVAQYEIKLKEFNFKMLYNIVSCNANLLKWGKRNDDKCDVCDERQTIPHLIYYCYYAKKIWGIVEKAFKVKINLSKIVTGFSSDNCLEHIVTLDSFLIYKSQPIKIG